MAFTSRARTRAYSSRRVYRQGNMTSTNSRYAGGYSNRGNRGSWRRSASGIFKRTGRFAFRAARLAAKYNPVTAEFAAGVGALGGAHKMYKRARIAGNTISDAAKLAQKFQDDWKRIERGYTSSSSGVSTTAKNANIPDDNSVFPGKATHIPVAMTHRSSKGMKNRSNIVGRNFTTTIKLGGRMSSRWTSLIKTQGLRNVVSFDSLRDLSGDATGTYSPERRSLTTFHGFNQRTAYHVNVASVPTYVYPLDTISGTSSVLIKQEDLGNISVYGGVMGTHASHSFSNLNNQLPVNIKVTLFYPSSPLITASNLQDRLFGAVSGVQQRHAIPQTMLLSDTAGAIPTFLYYGFNKIDPKTRFSQSAYFRTNIKVAVTKSVKLEANDVWTLNIDEIYRNGIDLVKAAALYNDAYLMPTSIRPYAYLSYGLIVEHWGTKVDGVQQGDDTGSSTARQNYIGTAPGSIARESKLTWKLVSPKVSIDPITGDSNIDDAYEYIVSRKVEKAFKIFNRDFDRIGKPGEASALVGGMYIPIESDTTTRYADTVADDTSAGD